MKVEEILHEHVQVYNMQVLVMRGRGVWCLCVSGEKLITLAKTLMFSIMMGVILT